MACIGVVLLAAYAARATKTGDGSESSDWNDPGNWVEGAVPSNEDVILTGNGYAPTNQNIAGLQVNTLRLTNTNRIDVYGEPFRLKDIAFTDDNNQTIALWPDITMSATWAWGGKSGCRIEVHGNLYEDGVAFQLNVTDGSTIGMYGTNYCSGGVYAHQGTIRVYSGDTAGERPDQPRVFAAPGWRVWRALRCQRPVRVMFVVNAVRHVVQ